MAGNGRDAFSYYEERTDFRDEYEAHIIRIRGYADYKVSILPKKENEEFIFRPAAMHFDMIPIQGRDFKIPLPCVAVTRGEDCPVCGAVRFGVNHKLIGPKDPYIVGDRKSRGIRATPMGIGRIILWDYKPNPGWKGDHYVIPDIQFGVWKVAWVPNMLVGKVKEAWRDEENYGPKAVADFDQGHPFLWEGREGNPSHWDSKFVISPKPIPQAFRNTDYWDLWCPIEAAFPFDTTREDILARIEEAQRDLPVWFIEALQGYQEMKSVKHLGPPTGAETNKSLPPVTKVTELPG